MLNMILTFRFSPCLVDLFHNNVASHSHRAMSSHRASSQSHTSTGNPPALTANAQSHASAPSSHSPATLPMMSMLHARQRSPAHHHHASLTQKTTSTSSAAKSDLSLTACQTSRRSPSTVKLPLAQSSNRCTSRTEPTSRP